MSATATTLIRPRLTVIQDKPMVSSPVKRYEGWLRLGLMMVPMIAGYYDLKYSVSDSTHKIDKIEERLKILDQVMIDVAVLKARSP